MALVEHPSELFCASTARTWKVLLAPSGTVTGSPVVLKTAAAPETSGTPVQAPLRYTLTVVPGEAVPMSRGFVVTPGEAGEVEISAGSGVAYACAVVEQGETLPAAS